MVTRVRVVLVAALVLTLATMVDAFVWDHLYDQLNHAITNSIIKPLGELFVGGSTGIVYNALTHNFLGIQPVLRRVWSTVLIEGGSLVISGIINVVWFVIQGIATIIYRIVESTIEKLWELKRDIILYGIRLIKSFLSSQTFNALGLTNPLSFAKSQDLNAVTIDAINLAKTMDKDEAREAQPAQPPVTVLRGGRNMHRKYYELKDDLQSATHHDPLQCLPLVLCAIHAEHDDLLSTTEAAFRKAFRPYFTEEQPIPDWAEQYVLAADIGTSVKSSESCQKAYPSCWYSARHLRELIAQAMEAEDTNLHLLRQ
ncbi:uncharacterized protein [Panulirus ornatus]|uniref:uncharacterized protein n=1 Tax=Panulirus ornatus TaxID=150431 RepID=UPI003A879192